MTIVNLATIKFNMYLLSRKFNMYSFHGMNMVHAIQEVKVRTQLFS